MNKQTSNKLEQLRTQRDALERALYTGALSVRHGDKQVNYRSVEDLKTAIDALENQILKLEGRRRSRIIYIDSRRGY